MNKIKNKYNNKKCYKKKLSKGLEVNKPVFTYKMNYLL